MFEDNMQSIQRLLDRETVVLAVVIPNRKPIRSDDNVANRRGLIVLSSEDPQRRKDIAILSSCEIDEQTNDIRPIGEGVEVYDDSMHQGILCSIVRGYCSMLVALGLQVLVPTRMNLEAYEQWQKRRKTRPGWLVVERPGIGGQPAQYKSSNDPPQANLGLMEFDPSSTASFETPMQIISENDFMHLVYSEKARFTISDILDPKHPDAKLWRLIHGDREKPFETPVELNSGGTLSKTSNQTIQTKGRGKSIHGIAAPVPTEDIRAALSEQGTSISQLMGRKADTRKNDSISQFMQDIKERKDINRGGY